MAQSLRHASLCSVSLLLEIEVKVQYGFVLALLRAPRFRVDATV